MKKISRVFEDKYFDLNSAVKKSYIDNGIGCLAVRIKKYDDVISRYSGKEYECLNHEFYSYLDRNIQYIPEDVPILLQVYGCKLKQKQKEIIVENIREHYSYKLGEVIEANEAKVKKMCIFGLLAFACLLLSLATEDLSNVISDFLNLAFCFYGSAVITFLATDIKGSKQRRIRAAQIANMYITIEEKYNDAPITENDKKIIYSFIKEQNRLEENSNA